MVNRTTAVYYYNTSIALALQITGTCSTYLSFPISFHAKSTTTLALFPLVCFKVPLRCARPRFYPFPNSRLLQTTNQLNNTPLARFICGPLIHLRLLSLFNYIPVGKPYLLFSYIKLFNVFFLRLFFNDNEIKYNSLHNNTTTMHCCSIVSRVRRIKVLESHAIILL